MINSFSNFLKKNIVSATESDVSSYFSNLYKERYKESTINLHRSVLKMIYKFLIEREIIKEKENPMIHIKFKTVAWRPKFFTEGEMIRIINVAKTPLEKAFINFIFSTGARADEANNIKMENINFEKKTVFIPAEIAKGSKERTTMISSMALDAIKKYLEVRKGKSPYLFNENGKMYSYKQLLGIIKECAKKSGVTRERKDLTIGVHTARHTFATIYLSHGGNIQTLASMLGHRHDTGTVNTQMTERYFDVLPIAVEESAKHHFMDRVK